MQYFAPRIFNLFNFPPLQLIFMKKIIKTDKAPAPVGPYNQAIIHNDTLYASGQIALDPVSGALITETIEAETTQVMSNVQAILEEAGLSFKDVVKVSVFVTDINNFARINAVYATYFDEATAPARELVQVTALPKGGNVEISVIAAFD
jgi:2-iminobutanoate/2-iminopropanoate deaminase